MAVRAEYDREVDALYIRLAEGDAARTDALDHAVAVDFDAEGEVVGVEVLAPQRHLAKLPVIAERYGFLGALGQIGDEVRDALDPSTYGTTITAALSLVTYATAEALPVASGSLSWGTNVGSHDAEPEAPREPQPA